MEQKGYDLLHLQSQITQIDSDLKVLATVFQQMNDTIASNKADNIATNEDQSTNITQLKAGLNGVSETLQRHNSRITAIEGNVIPHVILYASFRYVCASVYVYHGYLECCLPV